MKIITISTDSNVFRENSAVRKRTIEYGELFEEYHVVIFTKKSLKFSPQKISEKVWLYPTNSIFKYMAVLDAIRICKEIARGFSATSQVIVSSQDPFITGYVGLKVSDSIRSKFHVQVHADFLSRYFLKESLANRMRVKLAKYIIQKADGIRVVSVRIKNSLMASGLKLKSVPSVLPIFVDVQYIANRQPSFDVHHEYPEFKFIILLASRLAKEKNIPLALEVARDVMMRYSQVGLVIVGDGPEREKLKKICARYGIEDRVAFDLWQDDVLSYFKTADLFLQTSFHEGYGMSMIEAAASGCPIVTSDVGAARSVFVNQESVLFCAANDKTCFAKKIMLLIDNESQRRSFGDKAREAVLTRLNPNRLQYLQEYKKMAGLNETSAANV